MYYIGKSPKSPRASKSEESKSHEKKDKRIDVEVTVSYFLSPSEFHVQLASAGKDGLDEYAYKMSCSLTKPKEWTVHPAKAQISLGIDLV